MCQKLMKKVTMKKEEKIVMGGSNFFQKSIVITNYEFFMMKSLFG